MKTIYIQLETPKSDKQTSKNGLLRKVFVDTLTNILPKANPDFEDKIDEVKWWLVEFDSETGIPKREIGLDKEGRVILKMPFKDNYGFWIDSNLSLNDFKESFIVSEISQNSFEESWKLFDKQLDFETEIFDFKILSNGVDGGHIYLTTEINYMGQQRKLVIYFANKSDEQKVRVANNLKLRGRLIDEGVLHSLSLLDTEILDK